MEFGPAGSMIGLLGAWRIQHSDDHGSGGLPEVRSALMDVSRRNTWNFLMRVIIRRRAQSTESGTKSPAQR